MPYVIDDDKISLEKALAEIEDAILGSKSYFYRLTLEDKIRAGLFLLALRDKQPQPMDEQRPWWANEGQRVSVNGSNYIVVAVDEHARVIRMRWSQDNKSLLNVPYENARVECCPIDETGAIMGPPA